MKDDMKEVFTQLRLMIYGKKLLFKIVAQNKIDLEMDFVIILPEQDVQVNVCTLLYLNLLVRQFEKQKDKLEKQGIDVVRKNEKFIALTRDEHLTYGDAKIIFPRLNNLVEINDYDMDSIISRYLFMPLPSRIIVVSVQDKGLLDNFKVTMDEIIAIAILGISKKIFAKWRLPRIDLAKIKNREVREYLTQKMKREWKMNEFGYGEINK